MRRFRVRHVGVRELFHPNSLHTPDCIMPDNNSNGQTIAQADGLSFIKVCIFRFKPVIVIIRARIEFRCSVICNRRVNCSG